MAGYFGADYKKIRVLREVACDGRARANCEAAMGSILDRRGSSLALDPHPHPHPHPQPD